MPEPQAARSENPPVLADLTGKTVGRFAIRVRLGVGAMGEVYRAEDTKLKRAVALKRMAPALRADAHYRQRFLKEAEHASRLNDQRIAGVYDVLEENDETFLVMEYVEGSTLRQQLEGPFSVEKFLPLAVQCGEALMAADEKGIIHHDIKPENIMLTPKGGVKILDFGVAKRVPRADDPTTIGSADQRGISGTPAYMAPEVLLEGLSDARADIFSLGVVFYEMLSGENPFLTASFVATTDRILHTTPPPLTKLNPQIPAQLESIVSRMLAKEPAKRYATAAEVVADLGALERGEARPAAAPRGLPRRAFQSAAAAVAAVALLVVLLLMASVPSLKQVIKRQLGFVGVPEQKHVAVLPFSALGGGEEAKAFSKGLTETVNVGLTKLTERHSLQVVPASEIRARGVTTVEQARKEFGVNLVIEGSLQTSGEMVRVTYALVDADTHRQLRADSVTAAASDPFAVEDRVVASVLDVLEISLQPRERTVLAAHGTSQPAAYDYYLRGRGYLQDYYKPENIESAVAAFHGALAQDPRFALAYAGLGEAYWRKYESTKDVQWVAPTQQACGQAARLDVNLAAAQICLGLLHNGTGKYEEAITAFAHALTLDPNYVEALQGQAHAYEMLRRPEQAERSFQRALRLRPGYWGGYRDLGGLYYRQGRYVEAAAMFQRVIDLAPENPKGYVGLGGMYYQQGRWEEARALFEKSLTVRPTYEAYNNLATLYFFEERNYTKAAQMFEKVLELDDRDYLVWGNLASAYYWAPGERTKARAAFERAAKMAEEQRKVNPRDPKLLCDLADYYAMLGKREQALPLLDEALALAPNNVQLMFSAGDTYEQLGRREESLTWIGKALERGYPIVEVERSPGLAKLRADPRFELLRKSR